MEKTNIDKITIIGDIHGRTNWKQVIENEEDSDLFVFLGDYFDPYDIYTPGHLVNNFKEILDFKTKNFDKVILLIGNHDLSYISNDVVRCRYSYQTQELIGGLLKQLVLDNTLQLCYNLPSPNSDTWFVHAGLSNTWLRDNRLKLNQDEINEFFVNCCQEDKLRSFDFIDRGFRSDPYGDDIYQGPLWIRLHSANLDCPIGTYQIVGHTQNNWQENIHLMKITPCDSLEFNKYYIYELDSINNDWIFNMKKL